MNLTPAENAEREAKFRRDIEARIATAKASRAPVVAVVRSPLGPRCTVVTDGGLVIHGYRVADDYPGPEHVFRGWCCLVITVDAKHGTPLTDEYGNDIRFWTGNEFTTRLRHAEEHREVITRAKPPALVAR